MEQTAFATPPAQPGPPVYELSGWWRRAGAVFIDGFIVYVATLIAGAILGLDSGWTSSTSSTGAEAKVDLSGWPILLYFVFTVLLATSVMAYTNGKTIGMMATNIRVVREGGERISFGFAFYRENIVKGILFGWLAIFTLYIATLLNYLWPLWDDGNQALHDKICKTRVVRDSPPEAVQPIAPPAAPQYPGPPPASPPPAGPPPPPSVPPAAPGTYQPPSGFENPVPDDD